MGLDCSRMVITWVNGSDFWVDNSVQRCLPSEMNDPNCPIMGL